MQSKYEMSRLEDQIGKQPHNTSWSKVRQCDYIKSPEGSSCITMRLLVNYGAQSGYRGCMYQIAG